MLTIWKYELEIADTQVLQVPEGYQLLSVGLDPRGVLCLWIKVMSNLSKKPLGITIVGTGNPALHTEKKYPNFVGSVTMGAFVWHVFTN